MKTTTPRSNCIIFTTEAQRYRDSNFALSAPLCLCGKKNRHLGRFAALASLFTLIVMPPCSAAPDGTTFQLAKELLTEESYELSAVEFRRFAMETDKPEEQTSAYLFASYAYLHADNAPSAGEMNDRAEEMDSTSSLRDEHTLLSAETARAMRDPDTALYFYDLLSADSENNDYQVFAYRRAAALHLSAGSSEAAREELESSPADEALSLQAVESYANGSDKSPLVGGLLGLIPGAGYWYSGEIANGFRSLILNSLFIYGMVHTAQEDQWGAFGVITFFEITWYSGSIYGGIDAAQRYNKERLDSALYDIEGDLSFRPEPELVVPIFKLNIQF